MAERRAHEVVLGARIAVAVLATACAFPAAQSPTGEAADNPTP